VRLVTLNHEERHGDGRRLFRCRKIENVGFFFRCGFSNLGAIITKRIQRTLRHPSWDCPERSEGHLQVQPGRSSFSWIVEVFKAQ
jgi:hypothetical protein